MPITFFGPIVAALAAGSAIYYLFRLLQDSDRTSELKLARETVRTDKR